VVTSDSTQQVATSDSTQQVATLKASSGGSGGGSSSDGSSLLSPPQSTTTSSTTSSTTSIVSFSLSLSADYKSVYGNTATQQGSFTNTFTSVLQSFTPGSEVIVDSVTSGSIIVTGRITLVSSSVSASAQQNLINTLQTNPTNIFASSTLNVPVTTTSLSVTSGGVTTQIISPPSVVTPVVKSGSQSTKKGFVAGSDDTASPNKVASLNAKWYYSWGPSPPTAVATSTYTMPLFTPMFWNYKKTPSPTTVLNNLKILNVNGQENILLGYNEPDGTDELAQGNMTVGDAVSYWPLLAATGRRLGSPVMFGDLIIPIPLNDKHNVNNTPLPAGFTPPPIGAVTPVSLVTVNISNDSTKPNNVTLNPLIWLDNFLIQLAQYNAANTNNPVKYPDFIAVHWYGPPDNPGKFLDLMTAINTKYNLNIWITEFAVANWNATYPSTNAASTPYDYPTAANIGTNLTAIFMQNVIQGFIDSTGVTHKGLNDLPFIERFSWKNRPLLIPPNSPLAASPPANTSVLASTNADYMGSSALFQTYYSKSPPSTELLTLTPLGQLYASL
jgi:hypothetical protein